MKNAAEKFIVQLPEVMRSPVRLWFERLAERSNKIPIHLISPLVRVVACSEFAANTVARDLEWFVEHADSFQHRSTDEAIEDFVSASRRLDGDIAAMKVALRKFRNRFLLRVLWRELQHLADLDETLQQLSLLADRLLYIASRTAAAQLQARYGQLRNANGDIVPMVILGMGKLGGRELNFSSDIDLIFCYPENGQTDGKRNLSAQEYFTRVSRQVIALIDERSADGFVFRIDTRLRPFGDSGPPVVSFAALESYLLQHGRDWERYAYVKARIVGSQPSTSIVTALHTELIQPFVYRRYLDYGVFESIRNMQESIAVQVRRREMANNIKLGPGGIREAEFIVQALQLVRGGGEPALQRRALLSVLPKLIGDRGLSESDAKQIRQAYRYLRRVENFIQGIRDQQTHDLPDDELNRTRLFTAMRHRSWQQFITVLDRHRGVIAAQFAAIAFRDDGESDSIVHKFRALLKSQAGKQRWVDALQSAGASEASELALRIVTFCASSAVQQVDTVSRQRLSRFLPKLVAKIVESRHPVPALARSLEVAQSILRRSAYLALLNENDQALSRLVDLCGRSQYIANQIAQYPALMDELLDAQIYSEHISKDDLATEVQCRLQTETNSDSENQIQVIAQFQRAAMFRIAVADFNNLLPIMKVSDALTSLAEVVLDEALRVAWQDVAKRHGEPHYVIDGEVHRAGFGVVGYGKLGGLELSYGSDLDIVFLHNSRGDQQCTDGAKPLDNSLFFGRLVRRLVHFLTTQTGSGELYEIDTRLRPDGRSGLLVTSTQAFELYQEKNAWTWEHQALLRARAVAGSASVAEEFERIRRETLSNRVSQEKLRDEVTGMRGKMRRKLDRSNDRVFDLKHGIGGIGDIEFLVQYLVLRGASSEFNLMAYSDNIRQIDALISAGVLEQSVGGSLQQIYRQYRLRSHHRILDGRRVLSGADEFLPQREFVAVLWDDWLG